MPMKKYLPFAIGLLLALASVSFGQEAAKPAPSPSPKPKPAMSKAQIQKSLIATEKKLWEAWKNKDAKPFKATLAADGIMVGENGTADKATTIKMITTMDCDVKSYALSDFKLNMPSPTVALLSYKGTAEGTCGGTAITPVWASSIFVNRGGKWYAFSHQETNAK
jgi:Domain of unknown function (DUF4440)